MPKQPISAYTDLGDNYAGTSSSPQPMQVASYKRIEVTPGMYYFKVTLPTGTQGFLNVNLAGVVASIAETRSVRPSPGNIPWMETRMEGSYVRGVMLGIGRLDLYKPSRQTDWTGFTFRVSVSEAGTLGVIVSDWHDPTVSSNVTPATYERFETCRAVTDGTPEGDLYERFVVETSSGRDEPEANAITAKNAAAIAGMDAVDPFPWPPTLFYDDADAAADVDVPGLVTDGDGAAVKSSRSHGFVPIAGPTPDYVWSGGAFARAGYFYAHAYNSWGASTAELLDSQVQPYIPPDYESIPARAYGWVWSDDTTEDDGLYADPVQAVLTAEGNVYVSTATIDTEPLGTYYGVTKEFTAGITSWGMTLGTEVITNASPGATPDVISHVAGDGSILFVQLPLEFEHSGDVDVDYTEPVVVQWVLQPPDFVWKIAPVAEWDVLEIEPVIVPASGGGWSVGMGF